MIYYINYFFIYAIIGHIIESIFISNFTSGILYGWWTPIYGFGVVLILLIGKWINTFNLKGKLIWKLIITYILCMAILSIIELIGGYIIEFIFHVEFWNYENHKFNIGSYISLEMANIWGIAGITVLYILKPITDKFVYKILKWITYVLLFLILVDICATIILK